MKGVPDPLKCCPICGKMLHSKHRCDPSVLRAIDAANTRAENADDESFFREPFHLTEAHRLDDGFQLLENEDDEDSDDY